MALNKATLKTTIKTGLAGIANQMAAGTFTGSAADQIADIFADALDTYIKTATVTVSAGIPVSTTGTAAAQTGATTATGTGTLS